MKISYTYLYIMSQNVASDSSKKSRERDMQEEPLRPSSPSMSPLPASSPKEFVPTSPEGTPPPREFVLTSPSLTPPLTPLPEDGPKKADEPGSNSKKDFETMVEFYLASNPYISNKKRSHELEVRFGTGNRRQKDGELAVQPISKINYDNVVQMLYKSGFTTTDPDGLHILRIYNEYANKKTEGETRISSVRAEVMGLDLIQEYCRTNSLQKLIDLPSTVSASSDKIKFTQKMPIMVGGPSGGKPLKPVEFPDFNFRVAYQMENDYTVRSDIAQTILAKWSDSMKVFRYINRVRFAHPDYPVFADISIVKESPKRRTYNYKEAAIPYYTVQEAKLFFNQERYEIELELDNSRVGPGSDFNDPRLLVAALRKCIRIVLSGLQETNYPIANSEMNQVLQNYMRLINQDHEKTEAERPAFYRIKSRDFVGPSSQTLQLENIQDIEGVEASNVPNIRENYTVTDKADGERSLLYIAQNGRIYMINTNMHVMFTGTMTGDTTLHNSILDGEFIKYDKKGKHINLYAAFDVYFIHGKSVRELDFVSMDPEVEKAKFRANLLAHYIQLLKPVSILDTETKKGAKKGAKRVEKSDNQKMSDVDTSKMPCHFIIRCKEFFSSSETVSMFSSCAIILEKEKDGAFEYNTDGLIFTPTNTGVGSDRPGYAGPLSKTLWTRSFKWKPPKANTIDFLVSVRKDKKNGKDEVRHIFQEGMNLAGNQNLIQYKTVILMCGFDQKKHGYMNPMLDLIQDNLPNPGNIDNEDTYKAVAFQPTSPEDPIASICNVELHDNGNAELVMMTHEGQYFEEGMIVEFEYDPTKKGGWRWSPLRVRYDKTNELKAGGKNYGNAYHVANSVWHSLHEPVTAEMISMGQDIPKTVANEDVYYSRSTQETSTRGLRDFHNMFIKRKLILGVANRGNTLIDYAVGKAGDLPKWLAAKLDFVFGVDVAKDNIENHMDGACARYLNFRKKYHNMPGALFVNGTSGANIRNGKAMFSEKDKQITKAVFGQGPKDKDELGAGVYKRYGVGEAGFHVSSCQFALHYFFENERSLHAFLRNVAECTRINGYFIGTCYDGKTVFDLLRKKNKGESETIYRHDRKIYEITKQYEQTGFPDDELSLGYAVDVYQESINKVFREYLVNFQYLMRIMEDYGFVLPSQNEAKAMGLPNASGLFDELFRTMLSDIDRDRRGMVDYGVAKTMSIEEKRISFLNRYFVFRKVRNVNAEKVGKMLMHNRKGEEEDEDGDGEEADKGSKQSSEKSSEKSDEGKSPASAFGKTVTIKRPSTITALPGKKQKVIIGQADVEKSSEDKKPEEASTPQIGLSLQLGKAVAIKRVKPPAK